MTSLTILLEDPRYSSESDEDDENLPPPSFEEAAKLFTSLTDLEISTGGDLSILYEFRHRFPHLKRFQCRLWLGETASQSTNAALIDHS